MEISEALLSVGLLLVAAKLLEGLFKRFGISSIFAYATAGVILGPLTGIVDPESDIQILLNIGIFIFFFLVGIDEIDVSGFMSAIRGRIFVAAVLSVAISMVASLLVTTDILFDLGLNLGFNNAMAVAGVLSLSSLGIVAKVLVDEDRLKDPVGIQIFTAVVIAEILILFIIGLAISEHHIILGDEESLGTAVSVGVLLGQLVAFAIVTWFVCNKLVPRLLVILHRVLQVPQLSYGLLLGGLFLIVVASERIGLHGSLGALLFGAALASLPYQLRHDSMPGMRSTAEGLFVPLFFASAGLSLNLSFLQLPPATILALLFVPLAGKFAGAFISAYITRLQAPFAVASGLMAKGVAEIALLLVMLHGKVISEEVFSLMVLIMFGYILLTPLGISFAVRRVEPNDEAIRMGRLPHLIGRLLLVDVHVRDVLDRTRIHPDTTTTVRNFVDHWAIPEQHDYVVVHEGQLAGIVSLSLLRYLPHHQWRNTTLQEVLRQDTLETNPEAQVEDALQQMLDNSVTVLPVLEPGTGVFLGSIASYEIVGMLLTAAAGHDI